MILQIAVVDDIRLDREKLERGLHKWFAENSRLGTITSFNDGESLLRAFEPEKFQMVFMDILMNDLNGIETVQKLRARDNKTLIIFTTSSREYAFDAFPLHPFDYIVKPCTQAKMNQVLSEAVNFLEVPEPVIDVRVSRSTYRIKLRDISAVMSRDHYVEIVLSGGKCMMCSMAFREFEAELYEDARFLLCNRGIIINMDHVASLSRDKNLFIMKDSLSIPIKVRSKAKIIEQFTQYQISRIRGGIRI